MPFLTLILKDSTNRWTNIILGIIFTVLGIVGLADYIAKQSAYLTLLTLAGIVPTVLIVWYAWKWPEQEV
jgi:predicted membrane channel-forming protein YqfA (hemolysin III family)